MVVGRVANCITRRAQQPIIKALKQNHSLPRQKSDTLEDALQTRIEAAVDDYLKDAPIYEVSLRRAWKVLEKQTLSLRCALFEAAKSR